MFFGVIEFSQEEKALSDQALELTNRMVRQKEQVVDLLYNDAHFHLSYIYRNSVASDDVLTFKDTECTPCWFTDITGTHLGNEKRIVATLKEYKWSTSIDLPGQWIAMKWDKNSSSLRIATDFLGSVWLYLATTVNGFIFAQDLGALIGHSAFRSEIDDDNILVELGLGYLPDNSTIYKQVSIVPPGAVIELTPSGIKRIAQDSLSFGNEYGALRQHAKFELLDGIFERIYSNVIQNHLEDTCISLSAGLDSRYALALLQKHGQHCRSFTFGVENSEEVFQARRIGALAGSVPETFNFEQTSWSVWRNNTRQLGNIGMIQWAGWSDEWLRLLSNNHRFVLIGYLGDALSGKHLVRSDENSDWLSSWVDWSLDAWATSPCLQEDCRNRIRRLVLQRLAAVAESANPTLPHQVAMHLDLLGRQRRWVASQPNLISNYLHPKTFFFDKELVNFWINLPYDDLRNQRLYKSYAQSRFPSLFDKNEFKTGMIRRLQDKVRRRIDDFLKSNRTSRVAFVIERDRVLSQHVSHIKNLMRQSEDKLKHIIDFQALLSLLAELETKGTLSQAKSGVMLRGVNLMMLVADR